MKGEEQKEVAYGGIVKGKINGFGCTSMVVESGGDMVVLVKDKDDGEG